MFGRLKRRTTGRVTPALRRLLALVHDYPRTPVLQAIRTAAHYGLYDVERLERLILRQIAKEYFTLSIPPDLEEDDND